VGACPDQLQILHVGLCERLPETLGFPIEILSAGMINMTVCGSLPRSASNSPCWALWKAFQNPVIKLLFTDFYERQAILK